VVGRGGAVGGEGEVRVMVVVWVVAVERGDGEEGGWEGVAGCSTAWSRRCCS
jgi:hypothetical protein